jgi:hypothetical protein
MWLIERRNSCARILKERLAPARKAPERTGEARISDLQKLLAQADMSMRAGNFLGISALAGVGVSILAYAFSKRAEEAWIALLIGCVLPYSEPVAGEFRQLYACATDRKLNSQGSSLTYIP